MSSYVNFYLRNRKTGFAMSLADYSRSNPMYECIDRCVNCYEIPVKLDDDILNELNAEFDKLITDNKGYIAKAEQRLADLKDVSKNSNFDLDDIINIVNAIEDERNYIASVQDDLEMYQAQKHQLNFMASFATYDEKYDPDGNEVYFGIEVGTKDNKIIGLDATED